MDAAGVLTWAEGKGDERHDLIAEIILGLVPDDMDSLCNILPRLKPDQIPSARLVTAFRLLAWTTLRRP